MTVADLKTLLDTTNYPVAYGFFKNRQTPPYICFLDAYTNNQFADDKVHKVLHRWQIELYTPKKDTVAEAALETLFSDNNLCWNKQETFLNDEEMFEIIYELMEA